jgi:nuclear pore complex protein Nup188
MLCPGSCIEYLDGNLPDSRISPDAPQDLPYILNLKTIVRIHKTLIRISEDMYMNAAPMVLAWADILQTLNLRVAATAVPIDEDSYHQPVSSDVFEATVKEMTEGFVDETIDVVQYLASSAVDRGRVLQNLTDLSLRLGGTSNSWFSAIIGARMRLTILDLILSSSAVGYIPEVVEATLSALTGGQTYWDVLDAQQLHPENEPLSQFLRDPNLLELILSRAKQRFPYESALLRLTRALATNCESNIPSIVQHVGTIHSFTASLPNGFDGYTTTLEEENNNSIRLTTDLQLFEVGLRTRRLQESTTALIQIDSDFVIPTDTYGRMILDDPRVAYWDHQYSGLKYFGKVSSLMYLFARTRVNLSFLRTMEDVSSNEVVTEGE